MTVYYSDVISAGDRALSTFEARELVREITLSDETLDVTLSGLKGDSDHKNLIIEYDLENTDGTDGARLRIQYNGDTATNYSYSAINQTDASTIDGSFTASFASFYIGIVYYDTANMRGDCRLQLETGGYRTYIDRCAVWDDSTENYHSKITTGYWQNTANEITSMRLYSDSKDLTGTIKIYRLANVTIPEIDTYVPTNYEGLELVKEWNLSSETLNETITNVQGDTYDTWVLETHFVNAGTTYIRCQLNGDTGTNYTNATIREDNDAVTGSYNESFNNDGLYLGYSYSVVSSHVASKAIMYISSTKAVRRLTMSESVITNTTDAARHMYFMQSAWDNTTDEVTSMRFYTEANVTGTIRLYRRTQIKLPKVSDTQPSNFKAYELIEEWDLSNEGIDQTISWDGDTDDVAMIECVNLDCPTQSIAMRINNDSGTNYGWSRISQDGAVVSSSGTATQTAIYLTPSARDSVCSRTIVHLENNGNVRMFYGDQTMYDSGNTDNIMYRTGGYWNNTADSVTSIRIYGDASATDFTGKIRLYKFKTVELPEPRGMQAVGVQSLQVTFVDDDTINISQGVVHIRSGTHDDIYQVQSAFNKDLTGLSASTWYYIYAKVPASGAIVATDIEYNTTAPTEYDYGFYHATNRWRCIGAIYSDASSDIEDFDLVSNEVRFRTKSLDTQTPSNSWTSVTAKTPPNWIFIGHCQVQTSANNRIAQIRSATNTDNSKDIGRQDPSVSTYTSEFYIDTDGSSQYEVRFNNTTGQTLWTYMNGFVLPDKVYTGYTQIKAQEVYNRGTQSLRVEYGSTSTFTVSPGTVHIKGPTVEEYYTVQSAITKTVSGLTASTWYYVYARPPASGYTLTGTWIEYSSTAPALDVTKQGYYHGTNTDWRCIGAFYSDGSSNILDFYTKNNKVLWYEDTNDTDTAAPSNTWTDQTLSVPLFEASAIILFECVYVDATGTASYRVNGDTGNGVDITSVSSASDVSTVALEVPYDSSGIIETVWSGATTNTINTRNAGFVLPDLIYNGPAKVATAIEPQISEWIEKTGAYTALDGDRILADTNAVGAFSITLPASPSQGDEVLIVDANGNFGTANLTVDRNGENIRGAASNATLSTNWQEATFVYFDSTTGWRYT